MTGVREATPEDAAEIVRLRRLMFASMNDDDAGGEWERAAEEQARRQLAARPRLLGAFVVDGDPAQGGPPHLAACAVGRVEERLAAPGHPHGRFGFVFTVSTDERYRGRGFARATTEALLDWFAGQGVTRVDLHATPEAEHLYRSMGFAEHSVALSLNVASRAVRP
ncbi:GNAT family N-acetyltransferase [Streptomyces roseifaciens]